MLTRQFAQTAPGPGTGSIDPRDTKAEIAYRHGPGPAMRYATLFPFVFWPNPLQPFTKKTDATSVGAW